MAKARASARRIPRAYGGGHEEVIRIILDGIRTGRYRPGAPLVARVIALELGVSVAPVREALSRLAGEGVIELQANRSPRLKKLSRLDILNAIEVWEVNVGLMARLAAERIKIRDHAERVMDAMSRMRAAVRKRNAVEYHSITVTFQRILAEISENPYLVSVRNALHTEFWSQQVNEILPGKHWRQYDESLERIEKAILSAQPAQAEAEYRRHVRWGAGILRKELPDDVEEGQPAIQSARR